MNEIKEIVIVAMPHQRVRIQWIMDAQGKVICETVHAFPSVDTFNQNTIPIKK